MAHWDCTLRKVVRVPPTPVDGYPGWEWRDCGCCAGIKWGGEYPRDCDMCWQNGRYAVHLKSRVCAVYPGGPLLGKEPNDDR